MSNEDQNQVSASDKENKSTGGKTGAKEQNPLFGIGAGVLAMFAGSGLWILIAQKYQMTWMSLAVAYGISSAIKYAGNTKDVWYGAVGAVLALIAAVAGNLATVIFMAAQNYKKPAGEIIANLDASTAVMYLTKLSGFMGIIFYLATIYVGFWFSFKHAPKRNPMDLP